MFGLNVYKFVVYTGMTFEVKIEADSNDITEHPHDDKLRSYLCTVCDKRFTAKGNLNKHKQIHTGALLFSCTLCKKRFATCLLYTSPSPRD